MSAGVDADADADAGDSAGADDDRDEGSREERGGGRRGDAIVGPAGIALHAPTAAALRRARRNLTNFRRLRPDTPAIVVVNGAAAAHAIDEPHADTDEALVICQNSLRALERHAPARLRTTPAAVVLLHDLQRRGWTYWRA